MRSLSSLTGLLKQLIRGREMEMNSQANKSAHADAIDRLSSKFDTFMRHNRDFVESIEQRVDKVEHLLRDDKKEQRDVTKSIEDRIDQLKDSVAPNSDDWLDAQFKKRFLYLSDGELAKSRIKELLGCFVPHTVEGFSKVRVGKDHDGGYIVLDDYRDIAGALSFGINDDVSWDLEVANKGICIFQYDHTVSGPPVPHPNFVFHREAVGTNSDNSVSLMNILQRHNLHREKSVILKMDIEHSEWHVLKDTPHHCLSLFSQILGEFHGFDEILNDDWFYDAKEVLKRLADKFFLIHVHGNNCAPQVIMGDLLFPKSIEMTFVSKDRYTANPSGESFPGPLDRPNNPYLPDFSLGQFTY